MCYVICYRLCELSLIPATFAKTVVDINFLQLEIRISAVNSGFVDAVLARDGLPELGSDPVAALADLKMDDLAHVLARSKSFDEFSMSFDEFSMSFDEFSMSFDEFSINFR